MLVLNSVRWAEGNTAPVCAVWAIVVITIEVLVSYAVIVHGRELKSS